MLSTPSATSKRFQIVLIKPSHYDADGYVVQWLRSTMPSNSLAAVHSLAKGAAERELLGPDLPIDVYAMDETNTRVRPRAVDIARPLRKAGVQVLIGGFHVSGCLAMLPEIPADIKAAQDLGVCIYA